MDFSLDFPGLASFTSSSLLPGLGGMLEDDEVASLPPGAASGPVVRGHPADSDIQMMSRSGSVPLDRHDDLQQAVAVMDHTTRVTNELLKVVSYIVTRIERRGFGYSSSSHPTGETISGRKRGRAETFVSEELALDLVRYPDGVVGLELPSSMKNTDAETIGRLHALLQSMRNTQIWEKAMKPPEHDDAYPLSHHARKLFAAMDALVDVNPSTVRPSALHSAVLEMSIDLASSPSRHRRWNSPSPFLAALHKQNPQKPLDYNSPTLIPNLSYVAEDSLSLLLSHLLRPHSYEFEERWTTSCPQPRCKLEIHTNYVPCQFLDIFVPNVRLHNASDGQQQHMADSFEADTTGNPFCSTDQDRVPLQSLVNERMKGSLVTFHCPNEQCPSNEDGYASSTADDVSSTSTSGLAYCRPELKEMPPLLFILLRRFHSATGPAPGGRAKSPAPTAAKLNPSGAETAAEVPARIVMDSLNFRISRDFFDVHYRIVAAIARRQTALGDAGPGGPESAQYSMLRPLPSPAGEGYLRWVSCANEKAVELDELAPEDERDIEVLLCENVHVRR